MMLDRQIKGLTATNLDQKRQRYRTRNEDRTGKFYLD